jgi:hypothetical protein
MPNYRSWSFVHYMVFSSIVVNVIVIVIRTFAIITSTNTSTQRPRVFAGGKLVGHKGKNRFAACRREGWSTAKVPHILASLLRNVSVSGLELSLQHALHAACQLLPSATGLSGLLDLRSHTVRVSALTNMSNYLKQLAGLFRR